MPSTLPVITERLVTPRGIPNKVAAKIPKITAPLTFKCDKMAITIKPKKEAITEVDIMNNIMMNKIKIEKKGPAVPDGTKLEVKTPKAPTTTEDKKKNKKMI